MKRLTYALMFCLALGTAGCEKDSSSTQATSQTPVTSGGSDPGQQPSPQPPEPSPATPGVDQLAAQHQPQAAPTKVPTFFDATKRQIRDLPTFPQFSLENIRIGPIQGVEMVMMAGTAHGEFEAVVDFYDKAIKKNGWSVYFNTRDPGNFEWRMTKGSADEASVQVKVDKVSNQIQVGVMRGQRPAQETK
jgi:hypothetical protein